MLFAAGLAMIWLHLVWAGCGAVICAGALAGICRGRQTVEWRRALLCVGGLLLVMAGGALVYWGRTLCGIGVTLLAGIPWCLSGESEREGSLWSQFFSYARFAFWTFGAALLLRGKALEGAVLLAGSIVPWYALERVSGRKVFPSLTLLGEIAAWCGAAAALARGHYAVAAVLIALFFVSRRVDDFLLVRKGRLSEGYEALSFRAYLNLDCDEARRLRRLGEEQ